MWTGKRFGHHRESDKGSPPVAIGGIGGSGTRVAAELLRTADTYIGSDLNEASDNLWFTLLFVRPNVLVEARARFDALAGLFYRRMSGGSDWMPDETTAATLKELIAMPRPQHDRQWLEQRAASFFARHERPPVRAWGWKAPNTHLVIERLLEFDNQLRYVHLMRNGLDMAFSKNQRQLQLWGATFIGRPVEVGPRDSLSYWCAAHRRMSAVAGRFPKRVLFVDFDRLCAQTEKVSQDLLNFAERSLTRQALNEFSENVRVPVSKGRFREHHLTKFDQDDLSYLESWGYDVR